MGFPLPGIEIAVDNPDADGVGELKAKGPTVMLGYYENEEATQNALRDGWFYTGDLGYIDKDGYVFYYGSQKRCYCFEKWKKIFIQRSLKS